MPASSRAARTARALTAVGRTRQAFKSPSPTGGNLREEGPGSTGPRASPSSARARRTGGTGHRPRSARCPAVRSSLHKASGSPLSHRWQDMRDGARPHLTECTDHGEVAPALPEPPRACGARVPTMRRAGSPLVPGGRDSRSPGAPAVSPGPQLEASAGLLRCPARDVEAEARRTGSALTAGPQSGAREPRPVGPGRHRPRPLREATRDHLERAERAARPGEGSRESQRSSACWTSSGCAQPSRRPWNPLAQLAVLRLLFAEHQTRRAA